MCATIDIVYEASVLIKIWSCPLLHAEHISRMVASGVDIDDDSLGGGSAGEDPFPMRGPVQYSFRRPRIPSDTTAC